MVYNPLQAQDDWSLYTDCTENIGTPGISSNATGVLFQGGGVYNSPCANEFRLSGLCNSCHCREDADDEVGATDVACDLLPDLVVSPWGIANSGYYAQYIQDIDPADGFPDGAEPSNVVDNAGRLMLNTTTANIGDGPFEVIETHVTFCYDEETDTYTHSGVNGNCTGTTQAKRVAVQAIYNKPSPPMSDPWEMKVKTQYRNHADGGFSLIDEANFTDPAFPSSVHNGLNTLIEDALATSVNPKEFIFMGYHSDHGHVHLDDWVYMTLREKVEGVSDPLMWPILGETAKISFCIFDGKNCLCQEPYACTDINKSETVGLIDGTEDYWNNTGNEATINAAAKNTLADFPNYLLGRGLFYDAGNCDNTNYQGMSPGLGDTYKPSTPGNYLLLPCGLTAETTYYIVVEIDPLNLFAELNEENNVAVIPTQFTATELAQPEYNTIPIDAGAYSLTLSTDPLKEWSTDNRINGTVVVEAGQELHIENCTIEFVTPESGILVKKGGILHLHHATLRGSECYGNEWKGILVEGEANIPYPPSPETINIDNIQDYCLDATPANEPEAFACEHGFVHLENATIQDALIGVQLGNHLHDDGTNPDFNSGGGYLFTDNAEFINCSVGVYYAPHAVEGSIGSLQNSDIRITAPFKGTEHRFPTIGYTGVFAINREVSVENVHFSAPVEAVPPVWSETERGTGVWAINARLGVEACTFERLYKGIDTYAQGSLLSPVYVTNNLFADIPKGVTLNGNAMSQVSQNTFDCLEENDYAVFGLATLGIEIDHNTMKAASMLFPAANNPFGIVVQNSGEIGGCIHNNAYVDFCSGLTPSTSYSRFRAAVQAEGDRNPNLTVDCNNFTALSDFDFRILNSPDFKDQGGCDEFDELINPTANTWHDATLDPDSYHVFYDNETESFQVTYMDDVDATFLPILVSTNVVVQFCADDFNSCSVCSYETGYLSQKIADLKNEMTQQGSGADYERAYGELMRTYLQNDMYEEAKAETELRNDVKGDRILVATYTDERGFDQADSLLQTLPQATTEDIDFYDFFNAYIAALQNNTGPSNGKAIDSEREIIETMAVESEYQYTPEAIYAQSAVSLFQNNAYARSPFDDEKQLDNPSNNLQLLQVSPNPATGVVSIRSRVASTDQQYLTIYDVHGNLLHTVVMNDRKTVVNTSSLANGIYICRLNNAKGDGLGTTKLIILR